MSSRGFGRESRPRHLDVFAEHAEQYLQDYVDSLDGEQREKFNPLKIEAIRQSGLKIVATHDPTRSGPNVLGRHTSSDSRALSVVCAVQNLC